MKCDLSRLAQCSGLCFIYLLVDPVVAVQSEDDGTGEGCLACWPAVVRVILDQAVHVLHGGDGDVARRARAAADVRRRGRWGG